MENSMAEKSLYDYDKTNPSAPKGGGEWKDGYCTICTTVKAPYLCVKCGSMVCSEHYVSIMGLCVDCAPVKDTGKIFKISEPLNSKKPPGATEPTIQDVAKKLNSKREEEPPKDTLIVYRDGKKPPVRKAKQARPRKKDSEMGIDWV